MKCSKCRKEIPDYSIFCPFCAAPQKVSSDYDDIQGAIGANVEKIKNDSMIDREMKRNAPSIDRNAPQRVNNNYSNSDYRQPRRSSGDAYYDDYRARKNKYKYEDWGLEPKKKSCKGAVITTIIIFIVVVLACAAITYFGLKPQERQTSGNTTSVTVETKSGDETTATKEATTKETTKEAVEVDADSAVKAVKSALVEQNSIDKNGQTSDGGSVELSSTETTDIDGITYFIVQADYYDADGNLWETTYYGVSDEDGNVEYLNLNDDGSYNTVA